MSRLEILIVAAFLFGGPSAWAVEDAPEEVEELDAGTGTVAAPAASEGLRWLQYRGYFVTEAGWMPSTRVAGLQPGSGIGEFNLAFTASLPNQEPEKAQLFFDSLTDYFLPSGDMQFVLAQAGVRVRPVDSWSFAVGRERAFRAPGMMVNPSDFIHPVQNVPGQRMQRSGAWLARASYQTRALTVDAMFLPFRSSTLNISGLPTTADPSDFGYVARAFAPVGPADLGLSGGYTDRAWQLGLSASAYVMKKLEAHAELGLRAGAEGRALVGARYDVGSTGSLTLEGYYNGRGLDAAAFDLYRGFYVQPPASALTSGLSGAATASLNLFPRRWYLITGYTVTDVANIFNVSASWIVSPEDASSLGFLRWDWLISGRSTLGLLLIGIGGPENGQYFARPTDTRLGVEWRLNF